MEPWSTIREVLAFHLDCWDRAGLGGLADDVTIGGIGRPGCPAILRPDRALSQDEALAHCKLLADVYGTFGHDFERSDWANEHYISAVLTMLLRPYPAASTRHPLPGVVEGSLRAACSAL